MTPETNTEIEVVFAIEHLKWTLSENAAAFEAMGRRGEGTFDYARPKEVVEKVGGTVPRNIRALVFSEGSVKLGRTRSRNVVAVDVVSRLPPFRVSRETLPTNVRLLEALATTEMLAIPAEEQDEDELSLQIVASFARTRVSSCVPA